MKAGGETLRACNGPSYAHNETLNTYAETLPARDGPIYVYRET